MVAIVTPDDLYTVRQSILYIPVLLCPDTKTRQGGRDGWNGKSNALVRCIPPRFVIGGENRNIEADKQIIVIGIEDSVGSIQIGGDIDYLYPVRLSIAESQVFQVTHNLVVPSLVQLMGYTNPIMQVPDG